MQQLILVGAGGFAGAIARYLVSLAMTRVSESFPLGTLTINVVGSFLIGFLAVAIGERGWVAPTAGLALTTGFLGAFTTFSTFSLELLRLWSSGQSGTALVYAFGSVVLGLVAVWLGASAARAL